MVRGGRGGESGEEETFAHETFDSSVYSLRCSNAVPLAAVPTISSVTILAPSILKPSQARMQPGESNLEARIAHPNAPPIPGYNFYPSPQRQKSGDAFAHPSLARRL